MSHITPWRVPERLSAGTKTSEAHSPSPSAKKRADAITKGIAMRTDVTRTSSTRTGTVLRRTAAALVVGGIMLAPTAAMAGSGSSSTIYGCKGTYNGKVAVGNCTPATKTMDIKILGDCSGAQSGYDSGFKHGRPRAPTRPTRRPPASGTSRRSPSRRLTRHADAMVVLVIGEPHHRNTMTMAVPARSADPAHHD